MNLVKLRVLRDLRGNLRTMNARGPRIRTEVQVMFFDTDCGGVMSNIAYLRLIEIARTLLAEELGLLLAEMAETQRYPVVVRTEINYRHAAKLGDRLHSTERRCLDCRVPPITRSHRDAGGKIAAVARELGKIPEPGSEHPPCWADSLTNRWSPAPVLLALKKLFSSRRCSLPRPRATLSLLS